MLEKAFCCSAIGMPCEAQLRSAAELIRGDFGRRGFLEYRCRTAVQHRADRCQWIGSAGHGFPPDRKGVAPDATGSCKLQQEVYLAKSKPSHPVTPDGRYLVVRGRLWRTANPALSEDLRDRLVHELMEARRAIRDARLAGDKPRENEAHQRVHATKQALGERGSVWWADGAPDYNRHLAKNTPYAGWFAALAP
jgi:hypothetical protein